MGPFLLFSSQATARLRGSAFPARDGESQVPPFWAWKGQSLPEERVLISEQQKGYLTEQTVANRLEPRRV